MVLTPQWMHTNEYRAYLPDWPANIPFERMGRIKRKTETFAQFLHLISIGKFEFQIASIQKWQEWQAAYLQGRNPAKVKRRADLGWRRPDIHRRKRLHVPLEKPESPEFIDDDLEAWADTEVERMKACMQVDDASAEERLISETGSGSQRPIR